MFETSSAYNFERSDRYFFVIELLRIATEWIKETGDDLKRLRAEVDDALLTSIEDKQLRKGEPHSSVPSWKACLDVTNHNWGIVFRAHTKYEKDLLDRIERKMQEAKSLRDGVSSPSSARTMGQDKSCKDRPTNTRTSSSSTRRRCGKPPRALTSMSIYSSSPL